MSKKFTSDEVMEILEKSLPSALTSRDCEIISQMRKNLEENLKKILRNVG